MAIYGPWPRQASERRPRWEGVDGDGDGAAYKGGNHLLVEGLVANSLLKAHQGTQSQP